MLFRGSRINYFNNMITYVNSVFVSNNGGVVDDPGRLTKGKFIFFDVDTNASVSANTVRFKIGMGTGKTVKWSPVINVADIKGWAAHENKGDDTEDTITIDFTNLNASVLNKFAEGGKRLIVRLTFKDTPTRYRKWTESYEYVTQSMDVSDATAITAAKTKIAADIAALINKQWKRARVIASADTGVLTLTAMAYSDDNSVDSLNRFEKVRFNVNVYYTDPAADGWESKNKIYPAGVTIDKVPGKTDPCSAKLVRDREAQAMGYDGILNRGEGTWPIIKPAMETNLNTVYHGVTIEFENTYRAADDIFRKTKQTVEIYTNAGLDDIVAKLNTLVGGIVDKTIEGDNSGDEGA